MSTPYLDEAMWVRKVWPVLGAFVIGSAIVGTTLAYQPGEIPRVIAAVVWAAGDCAGIAASWQTAYQMVSWPARRSTRLVFALMAVAGIFFGTWTTARFCMWS